MSTKLQPALLAGVAIGILSGLPFVNLANACCCLWVVGGGALAVYLLQQGQAVPVTYGDGVLVGFLAGVFGFLVSTVVGLFISLLPPPIGGAFAERFAEVVREMPPDAREVVERVGMRALSAIFALIGFSVTVVMATIGGLIGTAIFQKKVPPGPRQEGPPVVLPPGGSLTPGPPPAPPPPPPTPPAPSAGR